MKLYFFYQGFTSSLIPSLYHLGGSSFKGGEEGRRRSFLVVLKKDKNEEKRKGVIRLQFKRLYALALYFNSFLYARFGLALLNASWTTIVKDSEQALI